MTTTTKGPLRPEAKDAPPVFAFFVGCGRSGTSLLRAIFDSHPDMNVPRDTYFILGLAERRGRYERPEGFAVETFLNDLQGGYDFDRWPIPFDEIASDLRTNPPASYPDAIRQIFHVCAIKQGKSRYGNKSPVHVRGLPMLAGLFPEARFIHIIRDGRNVALSYIDVDFGPSTIEGGALRWRRHVTDGRKAGETLGPERYREVRYEQLIDDPESAIRDLCSFVDIEFDERMLRYYERSEQLYPGRETPTHHRNLARPPTKGMRDWRKEMSAGQVAMFEAIAGDLVTELGYERGAPPANLGRKAKAKARLIALRIQAGMRRLGLSKRKPSGGAKKKS